MIAGRHPAAGEAGRSSRGLLEEVVLRDDAKAAALPIVEADGGSIVGRIEALAEQRWHIEEWMTVVL